VCAQESTTGVLGTAQSLAEEAQLANR
jgi:hypothetical protein